MHGNIVTFVEYLENRFGKKAPDAVLEVFDRLTLPAPKTSHAFLRGLEGALVFIDPYACVMRIERERSHSPELPFDRINDSAYILRPLWTMRADNVVIEICPGVETTDDAGKLYEVGQRLWEENIDFWDYYPRNLGVLPFETEEFPDGHLVVADRLAVRYIGDHKSSSATPQPDIQDEVYGDLRQAFKAAMDSKSDARAAWDLCREFAEEGKLVCGWHNGAVDQVQRVKASRAARNYANSFN